MPDLGRHHLFSGLCFEPRAGGLSLIESERRYFEVILEDISGKYSLVLEGYDAIRKEFNEQLGDIKEQQRLFMSLLKGYHEELKGEIRDVGEKVEGHEARIDCLERKVA